MIHLDGKANQVVVELWHVGDLPRRRVHKRLSRDGADKV